MFRVGTYRPPLLGIIKARVTRVYMNTMSNFSESIIYTKHLLQQRCT